MKENEIKDLNNKILYIAQEDVKSKYKDVKFVTFVSIDSAVQCGIKSIDKDKYNDVEEKNKKNTKNIFIIFVFYSTYQIHSQILFLNIKNKRQN